MRKFLNKPNKLQSSSHIVSKNTIPMKAHFITIAICFCAIFAQAQQNSSNYRWTRISSTYGEIDLPNSGKFQTDCLIADFNKDGKDEFMIIEKTEGPSIVMFSHTEGKKFARTIIEKKKMPTGESAAFCDIDNDGDLDIAVGSEETNQVWWWENPYPAIDPEKSWKRYTIKNSGAALHHDMAFGDFNGDGKKELAFWCQGDKTLYVASLPEKLTKADEWNLSKIYTYQSECQMQQRSEGSELKNLPVNTHQGVCAADINLDSVDDIVAGGMYFTFNHGAYFPNDIDKSYIGTKVTVGQLIEGDRPEVVMVAGDGEGPLVMYSYENGVWIPTILQKFTRRAHSLQLIDFDNNGHLDIFVSEMKTIDINDPKIFIILNDVHNNFERIDVSSSYGTHNSGMGDFDGDGDFDIIGKPYAWGTPRIDLWLNMQNE